MKNRISKVPLPLCGVMLGTAALGNLLQGYSQGVRYICGIAAVFLLILILLKLILFPKMFVEDMRNPIMASVSGTFSMGLMILSTYLKPFIGAGAYYIWLLALALHVLLIVFFTARFILHIQMPKVFASYYIVYVGIAVAAITAPVYHKAGIGIASFWFGFVSLIVLLILVTYRYVKLGQAPEPAKPLICIYAAPASLCVAGYTQAVAVKSKTFLIVMLILACLLYVFALVNAVRYMKLPFYPSDASFTFPFVITAIAVKQAAVCLGNMGMQVPGIQTAVLAATAIAASLVLYTYVRFMQNIFGSTETVQS